MRKTFTLVADSVGDGALLRLCTVLSSSYNMLRLLVFSFAAATNAFSLQFVSRTTRPSMTADEVSVDTDVTKAASAVSDILKSSVKPKIDLEVAPYHAIAEVSSAASAGTARQISLYSHLFSASSLARHRICHSTHTRTRRR